MFVLVNMRGGVLFPYKFVPNCIYSRCKKWSHNVISFPPDNANLVNHVPILEAVLHEPTIKRILEATI